MSFSYCLHQRADGAQMSVTNLPRIDQSRLAAITELRRGAHDDPADMQFCALEAVAYVAGEPWSDHPKCACPVLGAFMRS